MSITLDIYGPSRFPMKQLFRSFWRLTTIDVTWSIGLFCICFLHCFRYNESIRERPIQLLSLSSKYTIPTYICSSWNSQGDNSSSVTPSPRNLLQASLICICPLPTRGHLHVLRCQFPNDWSFYPFSYVYTKQSLRHHHRTIFACISCIISYQHDDRWARRVLSRHVPTMPRQLNLIGHITL